MASMASMSVSKFINAITQVPIYWPEDTNAIAAELQTRSSGCLRSNRGDRHATHVGDDCSR